MAPKPKLLSELGDVAPHGHGWRAWIKLARTVHYGPQRESYDDAWADLVEMRGAKSRDDVPRIAEALKTSARRIKQEQLDPAAGSASDVVHNCAAPVSPAIALTPAASTRRRLRTPHSKRSAGADVADAAVEGASPPSSAKRRRRRGKQPVSLVESPSIGAGADEGGACPASDPAPPPTPDGRGACPASVSTSPATLGETLCYRGLNINYPFSRLILQPPLPDQPAHEAALKSEEVRTYALGHLNIAHPNEELFIIETPAKEANAALLGDRDVGPPPAAAQVIGTVTFDSSTPYTNVQQFQRARQRHRIRAGSKKYDWGGDGERYAWHVSSTKRFAEPIHVCDVHNDV